MTAQDLSRVPGQLHYSSTYSQGGRVFSYAHQIATVLSFDPQQVLEVGVGSGVPTAALRAIGIDVVTVDIQPELSPDIEASVLDLPLDDGTFDAALCCQVLEHLPFDCFSPALRELRRVVSSGMVLSLPDVTRRSFIRAKLPKLRELNLEWRIPHLRPEEIPKTRLQEMGHYWEIGFKGYGLDRVLQIIEGAGWDCSSQWRVPELPWHRFFRLVACN